MGGAFYELGQIYDFVRQHEVTGFATVAGDRHAFWAGLAAKSLPPKPYDPVGVAFVVGSISAPGGLEAFEHQIKKDAPLRPLFLGQAPGDTKPQPTINMLLLHGVRSCLEYCKSGDLAKARELSNPGMAPHLSFVDVGGHGYAVVQAAADELQTEFVCIPRPVTRSERPDGGPILYRARNRSQLWRAHETPRSREHSGGRRGEIFGLSCTCSIKGTNENRRRRFPNF